MGRGNLVPAPVAYWRDRAGDVDPLLVPHAAAGSRSVAAHSRGTLPPHAYTGGPDDGYSFSPYAPPATIADGVPLPETIVTDWSPPGIQRPWPHDEYLHDGGDGQVRTMVTADGEGTAWSSKTPSPTTTRSTAAPSSSRATASISIRPDSVRCAAWSTPRSVTNSNGLTGLAQPVKIVQHEEQLPGNHRDSAAPAARDDVSIKQPIGKQQNQPWCKRQLHLAGFASGFLPHEDFQIIRLGVFDRAEKARLAEHIDAAITWTHDKAVQIVLDNVEAKVDKRPEGTGHIQRRCAEPSELRVIKVASTKTARPGEIVDFTIRFDNIGDQKIGNVTLVDNLTTRLEYVPDSAQSSRPAEFSTERNEGDSLVLRWEFTDPIEAGKGGLVRFHCKVR